MKISTTQDSRQILKDHCPAALSTSKGPWVSDEYEFVDTMRYVSALESMGWRMVEAVQRSEKGLKTLNPHEKHIIKFQNEQFKLGEDVMQLILINSHNGSCKFQIRFGIYRLVCTNGLVIPIEEKLQLQQIHKNFDSMELLEHIIGQVELVEQTMSAVEAMKMRVLTQEEMLDFAIQAIQLRSDTLDAFDEDNILEVLESTRAEDEGDNLWVVMNRVQEKLVRGGTPMANTNGKVRKLRKIESGIADLDFNRSLGALALEFIN